MDISRKELQGFVEIFYQSPFKIFYINSKDGLSFTHPFAFFVSLGITTPLETIERISECLQRVDGGRYTTKVVVLKSSNISGQFLNSVFSENPDSQYPVDPESYPTEFWTQSTVQELLSKFPENSIERQKLEKLVERLNQDGWGSDVIYFTKDDYRVYHSKVNYSRSENMDEYRIGIYVEENI